jgi:hypothetical protein
MQELGTYLLRAFDNQKMVLRANPSENNVVLLRIMVLRP